LGQAEAHPSPPGEGAWAETPWEALGPTAARANPGGWPHLHARTPGQHRHSARPSSRVRSPLPATSTSPYWTDLWPAARMLAAAILQHDWPAYLTQGPERPEVLEVGCGLGLAGLAAGGVRLARRLERLRRPPRLRLALGNARLNGLTEVRAHAAGLGNGRLLVGGCRSCSLPMSSSSHATSRRWCVCWMSCCSRMASAGWPTRIGRQAGCFSANLGRARFSPTPPRPAKPMPATRPVMPYWARSTAFGGDNRRRGPGVMRSRWSQPVAGGDAVTAVVTPTRPGVTHFPWLAACCFELLLADRLLLLPPGADPANLRQDRVCARLRSWPRLAWL
jgi:hypothetical protein